MEPAITKTVLLFKLGQSQYGLSGAKVREVCRAVALTALPDAPPFAEGVINYRGSIIPVLNVRSRLGHPPEEPRLEESLILATTGSRLVAFRVDAVLDLVVVPEHEIAAAAHVVPGLERIQGLAQLSSGVVLLIDFDAFLTQAQEEALEIWLHQAQA